MDIVVTPLDPIGGRNKIITDDHYGPASYVSGGEVWPQQSTLGGPNALGESGVINVLGSFYAESGNYYIVPITGGNGALKGSIKLKWYETASPGTEVSAGTNLSAEHLRLSVLGG